MIDSGMLKGVNPKIDWKTGEGLKSAKKMSKKEMDLYNSIIQILKPYWAFPVGDGWTDNWLNYLAKRENGDVHKGTDIAAPKGTEIRSVYYGVVKVIKGNGTYGDTIIVTSIINGKKVSITYAYMSGFTVKNGMIVKPGQLIGFVGNTGRTSGGSNPNRGFHLHFEVGRYKGSPHENPYDYLPTTPD